MTVKSGSTTICTITLASGKGTCTLSSKKLRTGTYHPAATFPAGTNFGGSTSARLTLTVLKYPSPHKTSMKGRYSAVDDTNSRRSPRLRSQLEAEDTSSGMYAAVAYIRAAASRAGVPMRQACQDLDERPGHLVQ